MKDLLVWEWEDRKDSEVSQRGASRPPSHPILHLKMTSGQETNSRVRRSFSGWRKRKSRGRDFVSCDERRMCPPVRCLRKPCAAVGVQTGGQIPTGMGGKDCCLWQLTTSAPSENFPDTLNCAEVKIIPQEQCEKAYPGQVTDSMVCASDSSGADTCQVSAFENSLFYLLISGCAGSPGLCSGFF